MAEVKLGLRINKPLAVFGVLLCHLGNLCLNSAIKVTTK